MIYAGQNNGYPWGPVGENTIVHGTNFSVNQQLRLVVVPGDSNNDALVCKQIGVPVGTVTTNNSGTFYQNFPWPASAGQVNQGYSMCSILIADGSVASSQDDGPFTVLTSNPPVITISSTSVQAGGTVTVTGHNWVPPQQVSINIAGCAACEPGNSEVTNATTTSTGLEAFYTTGAKHLTITAASVTSPPTVSPTSIAQANATQAATATTTSSGITTGSTNSGSSDNSGKSYTPLIIVLVLIALVLFAIAGVIIFILMQRSPGKAQLVEPAQYMQNMQQNGSSPNFGQPQPIQPGWPPSNFSQPTQQGGYIPNFNQSTPVPPNGAYNSFGQGAVCINCGRPLPPNAKVCSTCGMQQQQAGAQGPNRPDWVR